MKSMKLLLLQLLFFGVYSKPATKVILDASDKTCPPCNEECPTLDKCDFGTVKEKCGCCKVCIRNEGDICGGINEIYGVCKEGLVCKVRHPFSLKNLNLEMSDKIGRCETELCSSTTCGRHQWCKVDNELPTCFCRNDCESDEEKLCDNDGNKYKNICELRSKECKLQQKIPHFSCKDCQRTAESKLETIESGVVLNTSRMCEKEECVNGVFKVSLDNTCLKAEGFTCSEGSNIHQDITCPVGYYCNITKLELNPEYGYPNLGQCSAIDSSEVCKLAPDTGACYAYFPRWHFDISTGTCKEFIYGGCQGNKNNFKSKDECLRLCGDRDKPLAAMPMNAFPFVGMPMFPFAGKVQERPMSDKSMTISGLVILPQTIQIPPKSCLVVHFQDVTLADVASRIIATQIVHFSEVTTKDVIDYKINSKMPLPEDIGRIYSVRAFLNIGWCSRTVDDGRSIQKKDYLSDERTTVMLSNDKDEYIKDITIKCYDCDKTDLLTDIQMGFPMEEPEFELEKKEESDFSGDDDTDSKFPYDGPQMSSTVIEIRGSVKFSNITESVLKKDSCLWISLSDVTLQDAKSITLSSTFMDMSFYKVGKSIQYVLQSMKPMNEELSRTYVVQAVLNNGWCYKKGSDKWLKKGDFLNTVTHTINLNKESNSYNLDVNVICYECETKEDLSSASKSLNNGNEMMWVNGTLFFPDVPKVNASSCLIVSFRDVSIADYKSKTLAMLVLSVSQFKDKEYNYVLQIKKPSDLSGRFSVHAVLNVNWCSSDSSQKWIEKGDYLTVTSYQVDLKENTNTYSQDVHLICYSCISSSQKEDSKKFCLDKKNNITRKHDETWLADPCTTCVCDDGFSACAIKSCVSNCPTPIPKPGECCSQCSSTCLYENKFYNEGDEWSPDSCTKCNCINGEKLCSVVDCLPDSMLPCKNPVLIEGNCCRSCPILMSSPVKQECFYEQTNKTYQDGDEWTSPDFCASCVCDKGNTMCATPMCALPPCSEDKIINIPGRCCPICPETNVCKDLNTNRAYTEGEIWQNSDCNVCRCTSNDTVCEKPLADYESCENKVKLTKNCPAFCFIETDSKPKCEDSSNYYSVGQEIERDCNKCICVEQGKWECTKRSCPIMIEGLPSGATDEAEVADDGP
ncbi:cysteine rich BMP regulator 2 precursor [Hydra vulgaris]|uniref:Chordin-like protein n=1 Tax=Hydra vulgaris TaxID=6087 RepID=Q2VYC5_HYDVU|nr:cysteine rich BMP regulator 2 precursor [Hydra vulgaris]AAO60428.1 chordin-like protein [Hydra vulgaris]